MIYVLAVDWLSIYCHYVGTPEIGDRDWQPQESDGTELFGKYPFRYRLADYGTRQFSRLYFVSKPNPEGGYDDFAEIQASPYSGIMNHKSIIVRFVNRALYEPDFWELADRLLDENQFVMKGVTRIDICADFNQFVSYDPQQLILDFASKKLRHVGRGVGALYFNHGVVKKQYGVNYTGLSFGTHASDAHVYLYNKSFELMTQGDKPWIRDMWNRVGLDVLHVWRLEVSIRSKGTRFKDKASGAMITIGRSHMNSAASLSLIYHAFVKRLFTFCINKHEITNITREPKIELFDATAAYSRGTIRNLSAGGRLEKILIKALWTMGDLYRGGEPRDSQLQAQDLAMTIADSTDLTAWLRDNNNKWIIQTHK